MSAEITIVSRNDIRAIHSVEHEGETHQLGELRDFSWHEALKKFLPSTDEFAISWVALKPNETLKPHVHDIQSMMIIYEGSGRMLGQKPQSIKAGDVIAVPPGCAHGFTGGPEGLYAFSIQFGAGLYSNPEMPRVKFLDTVDSFEKLLSYNQMRLQQFTQKKLFTIMQDGTLADADKRQRFLDSMQIWVDGNQSLLMTRQATCVDEKYRNIFLQHFQEEVGHDLMFKKRENNTPERKNPINDPILKAITEWFTYQMYVLDNVEKTAIIHLMIENGSIHYHRIGKPALAAYINTEYFDVHIEADSEHAAIGEQLLKNQSPQTYGRLKVVLEQAWDMLGAMVDRVAEITLGETASKVKMATQAGQQKAHV